MANFPNGVGQITLAQAVANETVVAGPVTYSNWSHLRLPADAVIHFLANHVIRITGSFTTSSAAWAYQVSVASGGFTSCAADFTETPGTGITTYISDPEGNNPATGHWSPTIVQKSNGALTKAAQVPTVTFAAGRTVVNTVHALVGSEAVSAVTTTWAL